MVRGGRRIGSALALLSLLACCGAVPPAPNLGRRSRWALLGVLSLLAGVVLLPSAPVQAQTRTISNLTETKAKTGPSFHICSTDPATTHAGGCAIAFTTGGTSTARYRLNSITLAIDSIFRSTPNVSIHADSSGSPGTKIGSNLTKVGSATSGDITFNGSGITLNGGTTYFVQITGTSSGSNSYVGLYLTTSDAQTGSTGWRIANVSRSLPGNSTTWSDPGSSRTMLLSVNATATVLDPPTGFAGTTAIDIIYGGTSIGSSGTLSRGFVSGSLLKGQCNAILTSARLTCATGTMLEYGWYRSSAPKTCVGTGSVASRGGATVYRGDYTPTFSSDYQFLAY